MNHLLRLARWAVLALLAVPALASAQTRQEHVHSMSHTVMPFDVSKTRHVFSMTEAGGVMRVVVKNSADADQVELIRAHLQHEAKAFQAGNFSDPGKLHGTNMPGLDELGKGIAAIAVKYAPLPTGAQISFETSDHHLATAIHRWFGAQLSEHGADAESE